MPTHKDVANGVAETIEAAELSLEVDVERKYLPRTEIEDLHDVQVTVALGAHRIESGTRKANVHQYDIDVAVRQKVNSDAPKDVDPLSDLLEEIADLFSNQVLAYQNEPVATWRNSEILSTYVPEHLEEMHTYTGVVRLTFQHVH